MRPTAGLWAALGAATFIGGAAAAEGVTPAPAFTAQDLLELPTANWITNGGNIYNQRYSPLTQINRENVEQLKAVWRTSLNGSGVGAGYSAEAQPLVYEGVIYIITGDNDVFAVDVETGDILWTYEADIDLNKTNICCGWLSRGVGMGDGKIFAGQLDGTLTALDMATGEQLWEIQVGDPATGHSVTSAPLYYDGMVITGVAGGEYGIRGYVTAYDADTGEQIWRFYTIPGPGELGHETWPQDNDAWMYGGAPVWQTPAVDPELGMIYFSTGNPGPDLNGAIRPGDNLFSVSILALDVKTGEYRWHFQQVHHDIWDYDSPNPVILFDAEIDGRMRKGLAQVSKSGYLYILDRTDGSPLTPIIETPVPQEPSQATAATQPIPQGDPVTVHEIDAVGEEYVGILPNRGRTFTPFSGDKPGNYKPGTGVNWPPSSYDPESNLMYICANDRAGGAFGGDDDAMIGPAGLGQQYMGGGFRGAPGVGGIERRLLVAMNLTDHSAAWRRHLDSGCWGTIVTAGGLIFTGRSDGRLTAMDSETGQRLWGFQTDGGVNATATTFEHEGEQYVVVHAGGALFGGKSNDGLWLFSLNGTMEQLPPGSADRVPSGPPVFAPPPAVPTDRVANLEHGAEIYRSVCQACHGENGEGGHDTGAPLPVQLTVESIMYTADAGRPGTNMQSFRGIYNAEDLHDVATYITEVVFAGREE